MESTPIPVPDDANGRQPETARRPSYSRDGLTAGIVHFGVGHFHRAHQAMYVHRLLEQGLAREWAYFGVGVMPANTRMRDVLNTQDGLYTLVLRGEDGSETADVIGSITGFAYAPDDPERVIEKVASPDTKIITLTITEGGYNTDPLTGRFDLTDERIAADLKGDRAPATVFGIVTEALDRRRSRGIGPLTIVSCDNIPGNGHVTKSAFLAYAAARDAELAEWVKDVVTFPNTMVDRIVPATTAHDIAYVRDHFATDDAWPVVAEPWVQWIIEDDFAAGRPPLELVGVQFVDDVEPYELVKLRLLNATHQAIAYFAALADIEVCEPSLPGIPQPFHDGGSSPHAHTGAWDRLRRVPRHRIEALQQRGYRGYRRATRRRHIRPHPEVHLPVRAGKARTRRAGAAVGGHHRRVGTLFAWIF